VTKQDIQSQSGSRPVQSAHRLSVQGRQPMSQMAMAGCVIVNIRNVTAQWSVHMHSASRASEYPIKVQGVH
jgi:hypothetical protein